MSFELSRAARTLLVALAFAIALPSLASPQAAAAEADVMHIRATEKANTPAGWRQFCADNPGDCRAFGPAVSSVALTPARWRELADVNAKFNRAIEPVSDMDQYGVEEHWSYAATGAGDCEDYVLEKRRELIRRGWPSSVLLVTVVLDRNELGHAVLTVETDRGEYVLDNQVSGVKLWSETGLTFVKRQASSSPNAWVNLGWTVGDPAQLTAGLHP
jgi:predicted transglutaminase-like cysteine proteinase